MDRRVYDNYVIQIVEHGNLSKAAAYLGISQPALSSGLTALENELGFKIFNRRKVPITFTPEGELYFDYLKKEKHIQNVELENLEIFATKKYRENLEESYLVKEKIQELLFTVKNAKEPYGQVFWLRAYEEMSFKEIGEILGKSENWARANYYRAKEWIKRRMDK